MKTIRSLIGLLLLALLFTACEKTPSMSELLSYETRPYVAVLSVRDAEPMTLTLTSGESGEVFTFTQGELTDLSVHIDGTGAIRLTYRDLTIPMPETPLLRIQAWHALFHLSDKNLIWQIRKETTGGIAVYRCEAEGVTLYIDAATRLPLRLVSDTLTLDVLSFETKKPETSPQS